jgi:hypothetical protein
VHPFAPTPTPAGRQEDYLAACEYLLRVARTESWPMDREGQRHLLRRARAATHPDHRGGDQTEWDRVEDAARLLGLIDDHPHL